MLARKINLGEWDYFCTFTYDDKKHTEEEFRKKLSDTFKKMRKRYGWEYLGVWEQSPDKERLHFHGLFYTPRMKGELVERKDYSTKNHRMQTTLQNTYFEARFGRNDFSPIDPQARRQASSQACILHCPSRPRYITGSPICQLEILRLLNKPR